MELSTIGLRRGTGFVRTWMIWLLSLCRHKFSFECKWSRGQNCTSTSTGARGSSFCWEFHSILQVVIGGAWLAIEGNLSWNMCVIKKLDVGSSSSLKVFVDALQWLPSTIIQHQYRFLYTQWVSEQNSVAIYCSPLSPYLLVATVLYILVIAISHTKSSYSNQVFHCQVVVDISRIRTRVLARIVLRYPVIWNCSNSYSPSCHKRLFETFTSHPTQNSTKLQLLGLRCLSGSSWGLYEGIPQVDYHSGFRGRKGPLWLHAVVHCT